ncbi:MAG TPA: phenylalanine--tRNA ligase subunit beta, partial [Methylophaga sp.]|nr:phenylalanine--tRNA ligase subunit beta [Methylophaga sp.]
EKLRRSGLRSLSAVVDITNYVMLELGQPMHAFDLQKLQQAITVRYAKTNEKLTLLDGQEVDIAEQTLVIADASGPLALAGIMGGDASAVGSATASLFLEAAFFAPDAIAGQARSYGLHTDSSHRF